MNSSSANTGCNTNQSVTDKPIKTVAINYPEGISRYTLQLIESPAAGNGIANLKQQAVYIVAQQSDTAKPLHDQLSVLGCTVNIIEFANLQQLPENAATVISLLALGPFNDREQATHCNLQLFQLTKRIAKQFSQRGGNLILVQDTGGRFATNRCNELAAWAAGGSGLLKTASHEWPLATLRVIDIERGSRPLIDVAKQLEHELLHGDNSLEVGLCVDGTRLVLSNHEDQHAGTPTHAINQQSVFLVSGGARGVTASCLIALAKQYQPKFALLGRSALQQEPDFCQQAQTEADLKKALIDHAKANGNKLVLTEIASQAKNILATRAIRDNIQQLKNAGSAVKYIVCDVQDRQQLAQAVSAIKQQWGAITGLVHGAGVLADKLIVDKTEQQYHTVFNTKVLGLQALLDATQEEPLSSICFFSSVAARYGNLGQCDYAMANEVLNKIAQYQQQQRGKDCVVKSINWGPWDGGMVSPALKKHFAEQNIFLLPVETGVNSFVNEITHCGNYDPEVVVGCGIPKKTDLNHDNQDEKKATQTYHVKKETHEFLLDHSIQGKPVLPFCMVIDWFMRSLKQQFPEQSFSKLENISVRKSIRLAHFSEGCLFKTICQPKDDNSIALQLVDGDNNQCYSAIAKPTEKNAIQNMPLDLNTNTDWPWTVDDMYSRALFHGPAFQAVKKLLSYQDSGCCCQISGSHQFSKAYPTWGTQPMEVDVLALDAGLQVTLLNSYHKLGPSLPMAIEKITFYQKGLFTEPGYVMTKVIKKNNFRFVFDLYYYLQDGTPYATIHGLEMFKQPEKRNDEF